MRDSIEVLGLGSVALDEVLRVERWPQPDEKLRITSRERRLGGLTGHALMAARRFGARCGYAGRLGTDDDSTMVASALLAAGIDLTHATVDSAFGVVRSTIIAATQEGSRNVFSHPAALTGAADQLPDADVIAGCKVLLLDHHGVPGSIRAARVARDHGVGIVGDFERDDHPRFPELMTLVDHLILSQSFARRITGASSAFEALGALWHDRRKAVIVTCGEGGCWYMDGSGPVHYPAIPVTAVDTTGCGDVFHGVYAASLASGEGTVRRIGLASVAAGLKAAGEALPTRSRVEECLQTPVRVVSDATGGSNTTKSDGCTA